MSNEPNNSVIDYRRQLSNMLGDLKKVRDFAAELELQETAEHAGQTHTRIETSFFSVAVVGEFKRGKSTLINALLGMDECLPTDVVPCSATLNRVTYGPAPSARIVYKEKDGRPEYAEDIQIEDLSKFVTKLTPESEIKAADIKEAIVYYPTPYCRDKADIIDTPGLNDDEAMTSVTLSVIPNVDAAIMVVLPHAPFAGTEGDFLNRRMLTTDIGRVLFVVNRIDDFSQEERERLCEHISQRIKKSVESRARELYEDDTEECERFVKRIGQPKVFGVSAKQALKAKINGDEALLKESGFAGFENALERFLTVEKGNVTIQVLADCTASTAAKILHKVTIQEAALKMQVEEFDALYQSSMATLRQLKANYEAEVKKIDGAKEYTYNRASLVLNSLEDEIRASVEQVIDAEKITPQEIEKNNIKQTQNNLAQKIGAEIQNVVRKLGEKTQLEIERELRNEIDRLQGFAGEVRTAMSRIEFEFQSVTVEKTISGSSTSDIAIGSAISSFSSLPVGGLLTGYREAGIKGAAVGGIAGMGAAVAAWVGGGAMIAILGLPLTWPVVLPVIIAGGVLSAFSGKWAARKAFPEDKVDKFKTSYKDAVREKMVNEVGNKKYEFLRQLQQQVDATFEALKRHVRVELGSQIDQTQKTLEDLSGKQARSQAERELELKHLAAILQETEKIQSIALSKSRDLREITSV